MKRNSNKGFSLIELLVVIAIMVVLVGVIAPSMLKNIARAREAACLRSSQALVTEYNVEAIFNWPYDISMAKKNLENVITSHGGKIELSTSEDALHNGGVYSGICKDRGLLYCEISEDFLSVRIVCSKHGEIALDVKLLSDALTSLSFADIKKDHPNFPYANIQEYFNSHITGEINSSATKSAGSTAYYPYTSFAEAIADKLSKMGINVGDRTWNLSQSGGTGKYALLLANEQITSDKYKIGDEITVTRYDTATQTYVTGTARLKDGGNGKLYIDKTSFKPNAN